MCCGTRYVRSPLTPSPPHTVPPPSPDRYSGSRRSVSLITRLPPLHPPPPYSGGQDTVSLPSYTPPPIHPPLLLRWSELYRTLTSSRSTHLDAPISPSSSLRRTRRGRCVCWRYRVWCGSTERQFREAQCAPLPHTCSIAGVCGFCLLLRGPLSLTTPSQSPLPLTLSLSPGRAFVPSSPHLPACSPPRPHRRSSRSRTSLRRAPEKGEAQQWGWECIGESERGWEVCAALWLGGLSSRA